MIRPGRGVIRPRRRLAVAATWLLAATLAAVTGVTSVPAAPAPPAPGPTSTLTLASQTPWSAPGQEFQLRLQITPVAPAEGTLDVTVYSAVPNRSEFVRTLANHIAGVAIGHPLVGVPVATIPTDAAGAYDVRIPLQDPRQPRDRSHLLLARTGVYPVRVEYHPPGHESPSVLVTHLLFLAGPATGAKLDVTWIVPVHAPPHPGQDGLDTLTPAESAGLAQLAAALDATSAPLVLRPTPDTLAALGASSREQDRATLALLSRTHTGRQLISGTYVPVSLAALLSAGLATDATTQLTRGEDQITSTLGLRPDTRTWVVDGALDLASARFLRGAQVDRLVVPDADLSANPLPVTLAQPFVLSAGIDTRIEAVTADPGLAAHFSDMADPALAAHQLLADLAVLYLDRPGQTRGVVINTPLDWRPDPQFLSPFLNGLAASPVLGPATLDSMFATVPPATLGRSRAMVRTLVPDPAINGEAATLPADQIRRERARLNGFTSALTEDNPLFGRLERILLSTESVDLADQRSRLDQLDVLRRHLDEQLALIQLPSSRKITLTARTGKLPVTILSAADYPITVRLRVSSDKLSFPSGGTKGTAIQTLTLHKGANPLDFPVRARTAGSFPLHISVLAPSGLVLTSTTFTVQSTALSGVGLVLTIGAGLFLAVWWTRQIIRSRRRRRQPAAAEPAAGEPAAAEPAVDTLPPNPVAVPLAQRVTRRLAQTPDQVHRR